MASCDCHVIIIVIIVTGDTPNDICNYSLQITPERVMIHPQQTKVYVQYNVHVSVCP